LKNVLTKNESKNIKVKNFDLLGISSWMSLVSFHFSIPLWITFYMHCKVQLEITFLYFELKLQPSLIFIIVYESTNCMSNRLDPIAYGKLFVISPESQLINKVITDLPMSCYRLKNKSGFLHINLQGSK